MCVLSPLPPHHISLPICGPQADVVLLLASPSTAPTLRDVDALLDSTASHGQRRELVPPCCCPLITMWWSAPCVVCGAAAWCCCVVLLRGAAAWCCWVVLLLVNPLLFHPCRCCYTRIKTRKLPFNEVASNASRSLQCAAAAAALVRCAVLLWWDMATAVVMVVRCCAAGDP